MTCVERYGYWDEQNCFVDGDFGESEMQVVCLFARAEERVEQLDCDGQWFGPVQLPEGAPWVS